MKLKPLVKAIAAGLAGLGLLLPVDAVEAATNSDGTTAAQTPARARKTTPAKPARVEILNVELSKDGVLHGRISDGKRGLSKAAVAVRQGRKETAKMLTNRKGEFQFKGLKPGVYPVITLHGEKEIKAGHAFYRVWKSGTAPRNATTRAQIIPTKPIIRGQDDGVTVYMSDAPGFDPNISLLDAISFYDILIWLGFGTLLALWHHNHEHAQDNRDAINALKSPN